MTEEIADRGEHIKYDYTRRNLYGVQLRTKNDRNEGDYILRRLHTEGVKHGREYTSGCIEGTKNKKRYT